MAVSLRLGFFLLVTFAFSACSVQTFQMDKEAMSKVKSVAVVLYSVPPTIQVKDDPREREERKSSTRVLLEMAQSANQAGNGIRAATLSHRAFVAGLNERGLPFKVLSVDSMQGNAGFASLALKHHEKIMAELARMEEERKKNESTASKVVGFLASMGGGGGGGAEDVLGVGPEGLPSFGLIGNWSGADSALTNVPDEKAYLQAAIEALGVDAVMIVNHPGYSLGCHACLGRTGTATAQSAFIASIVNREGKPILMVRQWFNNSGANAAMVSGIINPLQYDTLFRGHGERTAQLFANEFITGSKK